MALEDGQNKTPVASPRDTPITGERATSANTGVLKEKAQDSYGSPGALSRPLGETPIAGLSDFIRRPLARVNPEAVSKVVDSATGEPLVVYHGTGPDFSVFRDGVAYFTPRTDYSHIRNSDINMPVLLAIKNPYRPNSQSEIERIRSFPGRVEELIAQGYDGMIWAQKDNIMRGASGWGNDLPQIVAFYPGQVKSAIANNGDYSLTNPSMLKQGPQAATKGSVEFLDDNRAILRGLTVDSPNLRPAAVAVVRLAVRPKMRRSVSRDARPSRPPRRARARHRCVVG